MRAVKLARASTIIKRLAEHGRIVLGLRPWEAEREEGFRCAAIRCGIARNGITVVMTSLLQAPSFRVPEGLRGRQPRRAERGSSGGEGRGPERDRRPGREVRPRDRENGARGEAGLPP